jgi:succinyl-CoA synthetase alpha subunit
VAYGTQVVAGVTPGKGGQKMDEIPVFHTVAEARAATGADCSLIFVPPPFAAAAIMEAVDAGIELIVAITEGIPVLDMMKVKNYMRLHGSRLIGPNCPGIITPGECKVGIMPAPIHKPGGPIGVVSRSGTLTYEVVHQLTQQGHRPDHLHRHRRRPGQWHQLYRLPASLRSRSRHQRASSWSAKSAVTPKKTAADFIAMKMTKPVVGFIAGLTAPPGRRMGHAGAIISGKSGTAQGKIEAMETAGIHVCKDLGRLGELCAKVF